MPMPPNVQQMRPGQPGGQGQPPQPQGPQQQGNPDMLKAKELMLKSELLKVQAQQLIQKARQPQGPQGQQGQPPKR